MTLWKAQVNSVRSLRYARLVGLKADRRSATGIIVCVGITPRDVNLFMRGRYQAPVWNRNMGFILLGGVARGGEALIIGVLPEQARPSARHIFLVAGFDGVGENAMRVDVFPDGRIVMIRSVGGVNWVSLSGISFRASRLQDGIGGGTGGSDAAQEQSVKRAHEQEEKRSALRRERQAEIKGKHQEHEAKVQAHQRHLHSEQSRKLHAEQQNKAQAEEAAKAKEQPPRKR